MRKNSAAAPSHSALICAALSYTALGILAIPSQVQADMPLHPVNQMPGESAHAAHMRVHPLERTASTPARDTHAQAKEAAIKHAATPATQGDASAPDRLGPTLDEPGPDATVYGYWPYWGDNLNTVPMQYLTHLAIFSASLASDGSITSTSTWTNTAATAVSLAAPYGVKVHLCLTSFDSSVMSAVLGNASYRAKAVSQLKNLVQSYGAHGVNLDFEGLPSSQKANLVTFVKELKAAVPEVFLATPAVDWNGSYDYDQLAILSDGLFIMGYDYHYSGGNPGPVAPLFGGSPWGTYAIDWSVDDYITWGAPREKLILGLPLYGFDWPSTSTAIPGSATGKATSVTYSYALTLGDTYGRLWDAVSYTPYTFPDAVSQIWYDDGESLAYKIDYAIGARLQGVGFWALTYEDADPEFWAMVDSITGCIQDDADGDGFTECTGDCDDTRNTVAPGLPELCDGIDNDCNATIDDAADADQDGFGLCQDCNDLSAFVFPGAAELCDGQDNDCDGILDEAPDQDGDGSDACADCDDLDATSYPGASELPDDGKDNNCDGQVDESTGCGSSLVSIHGMAGRSGGAAGAGALWALGLWGMRRRRGKHNA